MLSDEKTMSPLSMNKIYLFAGMLVLVFLQNNCTVNDDDDDFIIHDGDASEDDMDAFTEEDSGSGEIIHCDQYEDCTEEQLCFESFCQKRCYSNSDCSVDYVCFNELCFRGCQTENECGEEGTCNTDSGTCWKTCQSDADCPLTFCFGGGCYPPCFDDNDCPKPSYNWYCAKYVCYYWEVDD